MTKLLKQVFSITNSDNKKHKVIKIAGIKFSIKRKKIHDFSLNSGERQVATSIEGIRKDHIYRYEKGIEAIKKHLKIKALQNGADVFCGNGYGSYLIAKAFPQVKLLSIDGSKEAIELAKQFYASENTEFKQQFFPFKLKKNMYNFIFSLESIEHIKEDQLFIKTLTSAIKKGGLLILSTPNIEKIDLKINCNHFHERHYKTNDIIELLKKYNFELQEIYGQDTYIIDREGHCVDVLNDEEMVLKENFNGQFIIYVFEKKGV